MATKNPLVLLPGLLCDAALWQFQVDSLADLAEPIVADLTGCDSISAMATEVIAKSPPRFSLAGLSMGGYVAQEIMRQAPERVERLALFDTSARADTPEASNNRRDLIALSQRGRFKGITPRLIPRLLHADHRKPPFTTIVMEMAARVGQPAFIRQQLAILGRKDGREDLGRIKVPTLVLCGDSDILTPPALSEEMAALIPDAELVMIPDLGHLTTLERPELVNHAMREWLGEAY